MSFKEKHSVLGQGSFGTIIGRAIPEIDITKNSKTRKTRATKTDYPANITKLYKNPESYMKALVNANIIGSKIRGLHINTNPYTRKLTTRNLPKSIRSTFLDDYKIGEIPQHVKEYVNKQLAKQYPDGLCAEIDKISSDISKSIISSAKYKNTDVCLPYILRKSDFQDIRIGSLYPKFRTPLLKLLGKSNKFPVYATRSPNLGVSISDIHRKQALYRKVREVPYEIICAQMYKCIKLVNDMVWNAGYVHGDIRETNVMFNFDTMSMTIIDFDWLLPYREFRDNYPVFFYCHPPELLFVFGRDVKENLFKTLQKFKRLASDTYGSYTLNDINRGPGFSIKELKKEMVLDKIVEYYRAVHTSNDIYNSEEAAEGIQEYIREINPSKSAINLTIGLFQKALYSIDSYGLGLSFFYFLSKAWNSNIDIHNDDPNKYDALAEFYPKGIKTSDEKKRFAKVRDFIFKELIPHMTHSNHEKRWHSHKAMDQFNRAMLSLGIDMEDILKKQGEAQVITSDIAMQPAKKEAENVVLGPHELFGNSSGNFVEIAASSKGTRKSKSPSPKTRGATKRKREPGK